MGRQTQRRMSAADAGGGAGDHHGLVGGARAMWGSSGLTRAGPGRNCPALGELLWSRADHIGRGVAAPARTNSADAGGIGPSNGMAQVRPVWPS